MNIIRDKNINEQRVIKSIVSHAKTGVWDGKSFDEYFDNARWHWQPREMMVMFTRDVGHHSGGWWKNPDFERCFHLSISFLDPFGNRKPHNKKKADQLVRLLFGNNANLVWCEPPYSKEGIAGDVWHYRLFCDANWNAIKPRGEVYSTQFTEIGWKSFSELKKL